MDFKDFKDGLTSLSLILFFFSLTLLIGTTIIKPYIGLQIPERDFINILCLINLLFSSFYLLIALKLKKIFQLGDRIVIKFAKVIGIVTLFYIPHIFVFATLFFRALHNLEMILIFLVFLMELMLISLIFKEVYDLLFLEESQRDFELEVNRKKYIE